MSEAGHGDPNVSPLPHGKTEVDYCSGCFTPSTIEFDGLCLDCIDLRASPYWAAGQLHPFLYAPATTHATEFCRVCGKGRDSAVHDGSSSMAELYTTHYNNGGTPHA